MTKQSLIQLLEAGGDQDGEVQVYIREGGVEGWYTIASVTQLGSSDSVGTVISVKGRRGCEQLMWVRGGAR